MKKRKNSLREELESFITDSTPDDSPGFVDYYEDMALSHENNEQQTGNKEVTNRQQTGVTTGNKQVTNRQQTSNKEVTNRQQTGVITGNKETPNIQQTGNKEVTNIQQTGNKEVTNIQQTGNKQITKAEFPPKFVTLLGTQRRVVTVVYGECKYSNERITPPMTIECLAQASEAPIPSTKTAIDRLKKKLVLTVKQSKTGRGGWSVFALTNSIFNEMLQLETGNKQVTNIQQTDNKEVTNIQQTGNKQVTNIQQTGVTTGNKQVSQQVTTASSSNSSIFNNNINTNTTSEGSNFESEWKEIQTPEILKGLGFGRNIIDQVRNRGYLPAEKLQESLDNFAHDIACNQLLTKNPNLNAVRYFMGATKKSQVWISSGFRDPEEEALDNLIKKRAEQLRQKKEKEEKLKNIEFELWLADLPESVKRDPKHCIGEFMGTFHKLNLKTLFEEEFWPQKLGQINGEIRKN
ncbi:MAG: hypothetical protein HQK52_19635 [Oligoflexia bacterium]|nr:hypothetical protein [Oligoflexia bacterium]